MARKISFIFLIGALVSLFFHTGPAIGDTKSENVSKDFHKAWNTLKSYVIDQKHEAVQNGNELLKKFDEKIDVLKGKASKASGKTKTQYQKAIEKLSKMRANASKKLDKLQESSADTWGSAKEGFADAYKSLYDSYNDVTKKLKD